MAATTFAPLEYWLNELICLPDCLEDLILTLKPQKYPFRGLKPSLIKSKKSAKRANLFSHFFHLHHQVLSNRLSRGIMVFDWCYKDSLHTVLLQRAYCRSMSPKILQQISEYYISVDFAVAICLISAMF